MFEAHNQPFGFGEIFNPKDHEDELSRELEQEEAEIQAEQDRLEEEAENEAYELTTLEAEEYAANLYEQQNKQNNQTKG